MSRFWVFFSFGPNCDKITDAMPNAKVNRQREVNLEQDAESALQEEDVCWGTALAAAEIIRSGTVGFADHYFYMGQVATAVEEAGLRANLAWCVVGLGKEAEIGTGLEGSEEVRIE